VLRARLEVDEVFPDNLKGFGYLFRKSRNELGVDATVVYRAFDVSNTLLYVGVTCDITHRIYNHRTKSAWFGSADYVEFDVYPTKRKALDVEQDTIKTMSPLFNVIGAPKNG
jgi:predicted GIY-YIG superfamily endonuclease